MKKLIALFLAFGVHVVVLAQTNGTGSYSNGTNNGTNTNLNVPQPVMSQYGTDYPNNTANWKRDGNNYSAQYTDPASNMQRTVIYDKNGKKIRTDNEMSSGSYPTGINDYYTKKYPNDSYRVWSSEDNKGNKTYYSEGKNGKKMYFDKDGNYTPGSGKTNGSKNTKSDGINSNSSNTGSGNNGK